jgi:CDP-diacylglycerol--glycerol-3-phosphate 3-phosphatidyltransferase
MNLANKITVARLVLVPVFVGCVMAHANALTDIEPDWTWRYAAIAVFAVATLSDFLDGWVARRFHQKSLLGTTLDPIADKLLMLSAIFTLAVTPWEHGFPVWFVILVFVREAIILLGIAFMYGFLRKIEMGPHWISKATTALQMSCVVWILIDFRSIAPELVWVIRVTAVFMVISTAIYMREGIRQFAKAKPAKAKLDSTATAANPSPSNDTGESTRDAEST